MARRIGIAVVAAGALAYLFGFVVDHLVDHDTASASAQRAIELTWDASLLLPLVAVGVATHLWPRWWLVLLIAAFMVLWPIAVNQVELASGLREPLDEGCDPCVDATILSVLAVPALAIGVVSCGIARWRHHPRRRAARANT